MLAETIRNMQWAIAFSIGTGVLNLLSIGMLIAATLNMRRAQRRYTEAAGLYAQGTEARRAETGTGSVHDGPVA